MIRVEHLCKRFGDLMVLKDINAEIRRGQVISIIGPSGTGKNTFLRCLNLLDQPSGGRIEIDGEDILAPKANVPALRRRMGTVFQSFNLFSRLTVLENLTIGPIRLLGKPPAQAATTGLELLPMVGLAEKAHSFPDEISGGQKQRVAIARCLSMEPEIILLDEPISALDPTMVSEVLAVIRRLARQGMTMAIVTHEMEFARDVFTRVFYLDEGLIYEEGPPERIFDHPQHQRTRDFIGKVRSLSYHVTTADYDPYALVGKIEGFCEKHLIPHRIAHAAQLLAEEVLGVLLTPLAPPRAVPTGQIAASSSLAGTASTGPPLTVKVTASPAPSGPNHPDIELVLAFSEKQRSLEPRLDGAGPPGNPLETANLPDDFALNLIRHYAADIGYERVGERNRLRMRVQSIAGREAVAPIPLVRQCGAGLGGGHELDSATDGDPTEPDRFGRLARRTPATGMTPHQRLSS